MAAYPKDLAQEVVCQSHISRLTGLWFLSNQPKGLVTRKKYTQLVL